MNPAVILALVADLYGQVTALQRENQLLHERLAQQETPKPPAETPDA